MSSVSMALADALRGHMASGTVFMGGQSHGMRLRAGSPEPVHFDHLDHVAQPPALRSSEERPEG